MNKVDILKRADIFYDLSPAQYDLLADICEEQRARLGDILVEENTPGSEMYVIARGAVEVLVDPTIVSGPSAKKRSAQVTIATLRDGQTFGEVALVDQGLRSASARCSEVDTTLLRIPRDKLLKLCDANPELGYRIMRNMAADLAFKIRSSDLAIREQLLWRPRQTT